MDGVVVKLSDEARSHARAVVESGQFSSVEAYLAHLVEADHRRRSTDVSRVESLLLEALDNDQYIPVDDAYWDALSRHRRDPHPPRATA
jgi:hypothetical protein